MQGNPRWLWLLIGRVVVHAFLGALICAGIGVILMMACGAFTGWILNLDQTILPFAHNGMVSIGIAVGIELGSEAGGLVGAVVFGVTGFASPREALLPSESFLGKVITGMGAATLGFMLSYCVLCLPFAWASSIPFAKAFSQTLGFIMGWESTFMNGKSIILFSAALAMTCGLVAGAIWGHRTEKKSD